VLTLHLYTSSVYRKFSNSCSQVNTIYILQALHTHTADCSIWTTKWLILNCQLVNTFLLQSLQLPESVSRWPLGQSDEFVIEMSLYWEFPWVPWESHGNGNGKVVMGTEGIKIPSFPIPDKLANDCFMFFRNIVFYDNILKCTDEFTCQ